MQYGFVDSEFKSVSPGSIGLIGNPTLIEVTIDTGARDGGVAGGNASTELLPGVVLAPLTASGKFTDFDQNGADGSELEGDAVILAEKVPDISTGDQRALVYAQGGSMDFQQLRWGLAEDKTNFERGLAHFGFYNIN